MPVDNSSVPLEAQIYVDRLRRKLNDTEELNFLEEVQESTDLQLYECLEDALNEYATTPPFVDNPSNLEDVSLNILLVGATIQVLISKGILSARNYLSYSDAGGISVQDYNKYGRYVNYFNVLINRYQRKVQAYKISKNADSAWGGLHSDYEDFT